MLKNQNGLVVQPSDNLGQICRQGTTSITLTIKFKIPFESEQQLYYNNYTLGKVRTLFQKFLANICVSRINFFQFE